MVKYLNFIGSILFGSFVVPMFYYVSNYPQFGLQDTLLVIALFGVIWLGVAGLLWIPFRDISKVSFLLYGTGINFWFSLPLAVFFRGHFAWVLAIICTGCHWPLLFVCDLMSVGCLFFILKYFQGFAERLSKILGVFVWILVGLLTVNGCQKILSVSTEA